MDVVRVYRTDEALHVTLGEIHDIVEIVPHLGKQGIERSPPGKIEVNGLIPAAGGLEPGAQALSSRLTPPGENRLEPFLDEEFGKGDSEVTAPTEDQDTTAEEFESHSLRVPVATIDGPSKSEHLRRRPATSIR
jgi:hypothetical protein